MYPSWVLSSRCRAIVQQNDLAPQVPRVAFDAKLECLPDKPGGAAATGGEGECNFYFRVHNVSYILSIKYIIKCITYFHLHHIHHQRQLHPCSTLASKPLRTSTLLFTQKFLHRSSCTAVVAQEFLHRSSYLGVLA